MQNERIKTTNNKVEKECINKIKERKRRIRIAFTKMSLMVMLLIVSTYAWFTSQRDVTLTNLRGTVEVVENMEISLDAKTWKQKIDLSEAKAVFEEAQRSKDLAVAGTAKALLPNFLLPVSGIGELNQQTMPLYSGKASGITLKEIGKCLEVNGIEDVDNGYFAFDIYIKNTSKDGEDDILQLNLNSAVQVLTQGIAKLVEGNELKIFNGEAASGLQNTVRVGLALYDGEVSSTATQREILTATKDATIKDIAIWEPNASEHVEYIVENNNKLINSSNNRKINFTKKQVLTTYALMSRAVTVGTIENVYDVASDGLGIQRTFKTEKTSEDDYRILATDGKPLNIKSNQIEYVESDAVQRDFKITSNTVSRLRVYVWLEGQDIDCINIASEGGGIELDLGLTKDDQVGDVLKEGELNLQTSYELVSPSEVKVTVRSTKELKLPDDSWNYETTAVANNRIYQVASTENIKLASELTQNKKAIQKSFDIDDDISENIEIMSTEGVKDKLQFKILNVSSGTPCMVKTKYDKVTNTTGSVKVTISSEKQLDVIPDGWVYTDLSTRTEIVKDYIVNVTEDVRIEDVDGNELIVEVKIENIIQDENSEPAMTLSEVTNNNIGEYIDLGNNIVGTSDTTDDWRIFYREGNTVYVILADYLPNSTGIAARAGLATNGAYIVYSNQNLEHLITTLKTTSYWGELTGNIRGATAQGAPNEDVFLSSYNVKNGKDINNQFVNYSDEYYDFYVPDAKESTYGYYITHSNLQNKISFTDAAMGHGSYSSNNGALFEYGIRPVIELPTITEVTKDGDVWKVIK